MKVTFGNNLATGDIQLIPKSRMVMTVYKNSFADKKRAAVDKRKKMFILTSLVLFAVTVAAYPLMPLIMYETGGSSSAVGRILSVPLGLNTKPDSASNAGNAGESGLPATEEELINGGGASSGASDPSGGGGSAAATASASAAGAVSSSGYTQPSGNVLVIPKIGVEINIIESNNAEWAWDRGAWHQPPTVAPDQGGNTALSAHRFRYRPPYKATFYLLDKLKPGDLAYVYWEGKKYVYKVNSQKIVEPTATEVLNPTPTPTLTLITCHPLFSTDKRLIVTADLISVE